MSSSSFYKTLTDEALICGRCGSCRYDCPVYKEIGWESAAPRGKISRAREIFARGHEEMLTDEFAKRIAQCTLCGACTQNCASRININKFWEELRSKLAKAGKAPPGYGAIVENLKNNKNITNFDNATRLDWAEDLDEVPETLDCEPDVEVLYFVGCVSSFFPRAAQIPAAIVQLLQRAGVSFTTMGGAEWCCGFPLAAAGAPEEIAQFARHNVEKARSLNIKTLITGCSSCFHNWTHVYPEIVGEEPGFRVMHATEYLAELIREKKLVPNELEKTVTYHDPCDLGRNSGVYDAPRDIIRSIPGVTFVEMPTTREASTCCGGGGNLQSADAALTDAIAGRRIQEAAGTGAAVLVSACQQCEQILEKAARAQKVPLQVMDVAELLLMAVEE